MTQDSFYSVFCLPSCVSMSIPLFTPFLFLFLILHYSHQTVDRERGREREQNLNNKNNVIYDIVM